MHYTSLHAALDFVELKRDTNASESSKPLDSATQVASFQSHILLPPLIWSHQM